LALLLHPQQPLSYLERLIQAEVPPIKDEIGKLHPPQVSFLAIEAQDETIQPKKLRATDLEDNKPPNEQNTQKKGEEEAESQPMVVTKDSQAPRLRNIPDERNSNDNTPAKNELRNETESKAKRTGSFVRWSSSTEIGDFIRDASRVKEFLVDIEGSLLGKIPVAVPSFNDRTYYLRMRLRKLSKNLKHLAISKQECDILAQRGAQRVALGGLGVMVSWWYIVYKLTFETDYGWDTMEPITYLVSLSTLMGGYTWFLYHNREISYRSALDFTVSRRQQKLYQARGIDLQVWESLVEEANVLRKEIKTVAEEYDVDWDERADEEDERVTEALKHERRLKERKEKKERKQEEEKDERAEGNN
jgi:calcium uniporter protein, mitochondrial